MWTFLRWVAITALLPLACSSAIRSSSSSSDRQELTPKQIVEQSKPAIVRIEVDADGGGGVGTGFVLTRDGRIATNLHVIAAGADITVVLLDGTRLPVQEITATDRERDLAIVSVKSPNGLPTLALGDSDRIAAGDPVIAIGNPLGVLDYTVSDGLISSVRAVGDRLKVIQISAPISQGSSGGPLFNQYGEVIGVATFFSGEGQNLNFGIPSNYLRPLLDKNEGLSPATLAARVRRNSPSSTIERRVPQHEMSILDGCSDEALTEVRQGISEAIRSGAPLYNQGNHEACFRIYEGTAVRLEREIECSGLRDALGQGLLRASTLDDYTAKAWAMRDAFDGVLDVLVRKNRGY